MTIKVGIVVQRYGAEVCGGAELHARLIAEHLTPYFDVDVITTTALEHLPWDNYYEPGVSELNGVTIRRFHLDQLREHYSFDALSARVFGEAHSYLDEIEWMRKLGPHSTDLLVYLSQFGRDYDVIFFYTYQYFTTVFGLPLAPERAVLIPTAHDDPTIELSIYNPVFHLPRLIIYNTLAERRMVEWRFNNQHIPGIVVGTGIDLPASPPDPEGFRSRHGIDGPFILSVGRIEPAKGLDTLFDHFIRFKDSWLARQPSANDTDEGAIPGEAKDLKLVLMGKAAMPIPSRPDIISLGFVSDEEKFDGISASTFVVIPSPHESLSMINLEAWLMEKPVLSNGFCEVLVDNCVLANGGLYYTTFDEFAEGAVLLLSNPDVRQTLGEQGREYAEATYSWESIELRYVQAVLELTGNGNLLDSTLNSSKQQVT